MAKTDKPKKDKTKGGKKAQRKATAAAGGVSVAAHPRAAAQVRRAKGIGGIGFFAVAAYLSYKAGVPPEQVGLRALAFGIAGYMLAWMCSVTIWRHLVLAELRAAVESGRARLEGPPSPAAPPADAGTASDHSE